MGTNVSWEVFIFSSISSKVKTSKSPCFYFPKYRFYFLFLVGAWNIWRISVLERELAFHSQFRWPLNFILCFQAPWQPSTQKLTVPKFIISSQNKIQFLWLLFCGDFHFYLILIFNTFLPACWFNNAFPKLQYIMQQHYESFSVIFSDN